MLREGVRTDLGPHGICKTALPRCSADSPRNDASKQDQPVPDDTQQDLAKPELKRHVETHEGVGSGKANHSARQYLTSPTKNRDQQVL